MALIFEPITLEKQQTYLKYFSECSQKASDYSFINLWGWAEEYGLYWAWTDTLVWIKQTKPVVAYWAPVGDWQSVEWEGVFKGEFSSQTEFIRIPEDLGRIWGKALGKNMNIDEYRDSWDYLYAVNDLVELKGNRFHKKKNLFNQFKKKYESQYLPFEAGLAQEALNMQENWCTWRDCESSEALSAENRVITKILMAWEELYGITGGTILVDQQMVAYTVAEELSERTILIHFEKGNSDYKGSYQAINQMFLSGLNKDYKWVNREQDLGDEGLRKAKMSYHPVDFLKKYRAVYL